MHCGVEKGARFSSCNCSAFARRNTIYGTLKPFIQSRNRQNRSQSRRTSRRTAIVTCSQSSDQHAGVASDKAHVLKLRYADREITLETGEVGRQANGAVLIRDGETAVYTTACCNNEPSPSGSFSPFTVNYTERYSAIGRTSGGFFKREGRPTQLEMLTSRLIDRPLRPMLPKAWTNETQILSCLMSYDGERQAEPLAIISAGAALAISDIPLSKAVAGVHVGMIGDSVIISPSLQEQSESKLDLIIAGTADAILMIEGFCNFLTDEQMIQALEAGSKAVSEICKQIEDWAAKIGKPKRTDLVPVDTTFDEEVSSSSLSGQIKDLYLQNLGKQERGEAVAAVKHAAIDSLLEEKLSLEGAKASREDLHRQLRSAVQIYRPMSISALQRLEANVMRNLILEEGKRVDGRDLSGVRDIYSRCGLLSRTHGSALFTRGETQAIAVTTLGNEEMLMRQNSVGGADEDGGGKRFYLQYTFPPSSVGETGRTGFVGRREVGHGSLAERALSPIIPSEDDFPYVIRTESTITESNGSSSMASVCGGCLSLMDAGVPVKKEVAGVAMGLILTPDGDYRILTDILGSEDALGDMDFKVAGDAEGITAFQMDIKVEGISLEIMAKALAQAKLGRQHILREMTKCSPPPRRELGPYTLRIAKVSVKPSQVGQVIGSGGKTIRGLRDASGAEIQLSGDGSDGIFEISAPTWAAVEQAKDMILRMLEEPEVGKTYGGSTVMGVERFGLFVEFLPGRQGLLHVSELDSGESLEGFSVGQKVDVVLSALDGTRFKLSRARSSGKPAGNNGVLRSSENGSPAFSDLRQPNRLGAGEDASSSNQDPLTPPPAGTIHRNARVVDAKPYGIFVELPSGFQGLVHISELYRANEADRKSYKAGDTVDVMTLPPRETQPDKLRFSRKQVPSLEEADGTAAAA